MDRWDKFLEQLAVIRKAPLPHLAALVVGLGLIWVVVNWGYSVTISSLESRLKLAQDERDNYRNKLQGASPEQAAQRIDALEKRVNALQPKPARRLNDDERKKLKAAIEPIAAELAGLPIFMEGTGEAVRYATDFVEVLRDAKVNTMPLSHGVALTDEQRGIMVGIRNPAAPSDRAKKFISALQSAGLVVNTTEWPAEVAAIFPLDFNLFICRP